MTSLHLAGARRPPARALLAWLLLSTFAAPGARAADAPAPAGAAVLASVDGVPITVERFAREMARRGGGRPGRFETIEERRALLDEMVRQRALAVTARNEGYAEHPEIQILLEQAMVAKFTRDHLDGLLAEASVSEDEIESYYREHRADYTEPERVRGALILIEIPRGASPERRAELEREAESIRARAAEADSSGFAALARRHSDDRASRSLGGGIGWIRRTGRPLKWGEEVVDALFALEEPGDVGPVVRGEKGLWVVQLVARDEARLRPLEQLRAGIEHRLVKEQRDLLRRQFYRRIETALELEVNGELLEALEVPAGGPPPVPGR